MSILLKGAKTLRLGEPTRQDHGQVGVEGSEVAQCLRPAHTGHGEIEEHSTNIRCVAAENVQRVHPVSGGPDGETRRLQHAPCQGANGRVVIHHQDDAGFA